VAPDGVRVHPHALCESDDVGPGTRVWAFAHVLSGARIGRDCNICDGAFVEDGAVLGDRVTVKNATLVFTGVTCENEVFLGPNVLFTNDLRPRAAIRKPRDELIATVVRRGASLGAGTVVVCGVEIGEHAFTAAGSVIIRDVPAHAFVAGNPARAKGWVCACGERLSDDLHCPACGSRHEHRPDGRGLRPTDIRSSPVDHSHDVTTPYACDDE
jgi:UDP-2-acetamido-3-amino-2,3-dideoxy-glucuronate N-acetyltransferase